MKSGLICCLMLCILLVGCESKKVKGIKNMVDSVSFQNWRID